MEQKHRPPSFLDFPWEIRHLIYDFTLVLPGYSPVDVLSGYISDRRDLGLGLLKTCRSIYREASKIFYEENLFSFELSPIAWGPARAHPAQPRMKHVQIRIFITPDPLTVRQGTVREIMHSMDQRYLLAIRQDIKRVVEPFEQSKRIEDLFIEMLCSCHPPNSCRNARHQGEMLLNPFWGIRSTRAHIFGLWRLIDTQTTFELRKVLESGDKYLMSNTIHVPDEELEEQQTEDESMAFEVSTPDMSTLAPFDWRTFFDESLSEDDDSSDSSFDGSASPAERRTLPVIMQEALIPYIDKLHDDEINERG